MSYERRYHFFILCLKWERKKIKLSLLSVQFSLSVVSSFLWPHGLQHAKLPCPSPGAYPNSCPSSWWCHPTISSSVTLFSSCPQSSPVSGSFPMSQLFASGGQRIGASISASILSMNIQGWFPLGLTGLISLLSKGLSRVFSEYSLSLKACHIALKLLTQYLARKGFIIIPY